MSGSISPATASLALVALNVAAKRAQPRRNGRELPARWVTAIRELEGVRDTNGSVVGGTRPASSAPSAASFELLTTGEAAERLGISERGVRKRLERGRLAGRRFDRRWVADDLLFAMREQDQSKARLCVVPDANELGLTEPNEKGRQYRHGTLSGYTAGRCRCVDCRGAFATYRARRRAEGKDHPRRPRTRETDGHVAGACG